VSPEWGNPSDDGRRTTTVWTVSDDALVAGLAAGDQDAASAFVRRFQRRVYGLAKTIIIDDRAAEDIAQEAFVRAWKHAGAYDPRRGSVVGWLLTITRNLAIDAVRVRRPVAFDPVALLGLEQPSGDRDLADLAQLSDDSVRLRHALTKLPEEQRRAIVLAGLLGYTAREVGEIEDIPLGTAKTRIRTALIRLRAALVSEERTE
jgi:RNA polymerase sigma factor (sigma-70 family)